MKVTFYTNAMVMLESNYSRVLCDPWVTFNDESSSDFYNFPRCSMTKEEVAAIKPDFIYITHTHPDHFDPTTLALFDKGTPILVSYYRNNFTERNIRSLGFYDVRVSDPEKGLALNNEDHCWIEPAAKTSLVDSIAVFRLGGQTAVNANDNSFDREQCRSLVQRYGDIDIALLPSGAHGPWPMFFGNLSLEEKKKAAEERSQRLKDSFKNYIEAFAPKWVVPIAGGIICAGDKARQYAYSGIRPRSEVVNYAKKQVDFEPIFLSQGNRYDFSTGEREGDYVEQSFDTEKEYIETLSHKKNKFSQGGGFYIPPKDRIDLTRLLTLARKTQRVWQERMNSTSKFAYYFDVGEEYLYRLSLADDDVTRVREKDIVDKQYEIFRLPYELLLGLLTRHYIWSNVNTQYMDFYRGGGEMDSDLMLLINFLQI